ncbi:hypothetical protein [Hydrocarboniphaga effusa]|uniref:hypothetical protein n=1 Tax=Hydrocarboniphaga effusa TaxID=243629 RepID=UPI003BAB3D67
MTQPKTIESIKRRATTLKKAEGIKHHEALERVAKEAGFENYRHALATLAKPLTTFWISWYQPTEDHRPLTFPPNADVLGWWCTGQRCEDGASTLVAFVKARDEASAKSAVQIDWPEATEWRFCEVRTRIKPGSRFPFEDWMRERIAAWRVKEA